MFRVALWTPAFLVLFTLVCARIYERCELARELKSFGIDQNEISTWVCIAYHESRFNTAANNPHSGDHGIFQISELYWCGIGKECGLPCSALRDEDIRDDFTCAMHIYKEHTRLQGNGYLAWVVYPHNCRHNTKKYIAGCDSQDINRAAYKPVQTFSGEIFQNNTSFDYNPQPASNRLPSFLAVSSLFRENYGKISELNNKANIDWYNYKVDNIDALKLHVSDKPTDIAIITTTTTTPSTTTAYIPPVKPWRTIETNQFRRKSSPKTTSTPTTKYIASSTEKSTTTTIKHIALTTVDKLPTKTTTTRRPFTFSTLTSTTAKLTNVTRLVNKPAVITTTPRSKSIHISSTLKPTTTKFVPNYTFRTTTNAYLSTKPFYLTSTARTSPKIEVTTTRPISKITTTTQSIFDLYLNPTKQPKLSTYSFPSFDDGKFKVKIFSGGTTPPPVNKQVEPSRH